MAFDAYGSTDLFALGIFALALVVAYLMGGFSNFFLRRQFMSDAVFSLLVMVTVAFVVINFFDQHGKPRAFATGVDWRLIPASVLILFALWILAGLALACSTRFDVIPTLAICSTLFLLGIMSDYLFGRQAEPVWRYDLTEEVNSSRWSESQKALLKEVTAKYDQDRNGKLEPAEREAIGAEDRARLRQAGMGGVWWASVLYTVTPNWQLFWVADALDESKTAFHWGYVVKAFGYMAAYVGAVLTAAILLFRERELS
jgi:hypothetical protein